MSAPNETGRGGKFAEWEYYLEEMPAGQGVTMFFHTVREKGGKNIVRLHDETTARFIVSSCNSRDALVTACHVLIKAMDYENDDIGARIEMEEWAVAQAKAAIQLATE